MARIVLLACGAALFPALLACVAILISRPNPRRLILSFYLGGLTVSIVSGLIILRVFENGGEVAGSTSRDPHGTVSIAIGVVGLSLAWLLVARRGRVLMERRRARRSPGANKEKSPSRVERRLSRANVRIAFLVGAAINLPGPFYLLALGDLASNYGTAEQIAGIVLFNAIMLLLLEVPLVGYLLAPGRTGRAVEATGRWLNENGLQILSAVITVFSATLIIEGIAAL